MRTGPERSGVQRRASACAGSGDTLDGDAHGAKNIDATPPATSRRAIVPTLFFIWIPRFGRG
jgi:hypothetical protein